MKETDCNCNNISFGIPEIDSQHKEFISQFDKLVQKMNEQKHFNDIRPALNKFAEFASGYFRHEETFLIKILDQAAFADHRSRHLFFENYLRDPICINEDKTGISEVIYFLKRWVCFHMHFLDKSIFG